MVERSARAMWDGLRWNPDLPSFAHECPWDGEWPMGSDNIRALFRALARAAIEAMREPTEAMLNAGPLEPYMDAHVWGRMIDAALTSE